MSRFLWSSDFTIDRFGLLAKKTGHYISFDRTLVRTAADWFSFYLLEQMRRTGRFLKGRRRMRVAFVPEIPRPWYLIWPVMHSGAELVKDPDRADVIMWFDDSTIGDPSCFPRHDKVFDHRRFINFGCSDISKSRIDAVFRAEFGYGADIEPETHNGPMVVKSENNGAHDGRIVIGPVARLDGFVYQRVIDNRVGRGLVEDLRTCVVGSRPVLTFRKRRLESHRFSNDNSEVELARVEDVFSPSELRAIGRFADAMRLDWAGMDILRDRDDQRLYIVDANKTDMGPPCFLPLRQKLQAVDRLSAAFVEQFSPRGVGAAPLSFR